MATMDLNYELSCISRNTSVSPLAAAAAAAAAAASL